MARDEHEAGQEPEARDEWLRDSGLNPGEKAFLRRRHARNVPPVAFALGLIAGGLLLFLNSLGWLPVRHFWDLWPLIFVWIGADRFFSGRDSADRAVGMLFIFGGLLALAFTLHLIAIRAKDGTWVVALLFILFGSSLLVKALQGPMRPPRGMFNTGASISVTADTLHDATIMGSIKRKFDNQNFKGGSIWNLMGNVEVDLRRAQIGTPTRSAGIEVKSYFGAVKIRIPESWRLNLNGASILGVFEDKTIPPSTGLDAPAIVITGYSAFSSVEIEN